MLNNYHRGDGVCIHYKPNFGCTVYDSRPIACRVDEGYQVFASDRMTLEEYYRGNARVCNQLQEAAGLSLDWRVML
jgi:hypothetical protein